jgi:hypothetical protein
MVEQGDPINGPGAEIADRWACGMYVDYAQIKKQKVSKRARSPFRPNKPIVE